MSTATHSSKACLLSIVIPAYKSTYLEAALTSIAAQTCQRFQLYIGDDASPQPIQPICATWSERLPIQYHRFEQNLGGHDLVGQWARCIDLTRSPWIWLFSDDDVMDPDCVAAFYRTIEKKPEAEVFHFDTRKIDEQGHPVSAHDPFPPRIGSRDFALQRFTGQLRSYAPEYMFHRDAYQRAGGFPNFPLAWCSDNAGWIAMGAQGIFTIAGPRVSWRVSADHISNRAADNRDGKWQASLAYVNWLTDYLADHPAASGEPSDETITDAGLDWLIRSAANRGSLLTGTKWMDIIRLRPQKNRIALASRCLRTDARTLMRGRKNSR